MEIIKEKVLQELKDTGFSILPKYWDSKKCIQAKQELLQVPLDMFEVGQGGDLRFQHANKYIASANSFLKDSFILEVAQSYSDCNVPNRIVAGIVEHKDGKVIDSGGSWHVDSEKEHQFKSFMYLSDVGPKNGPFTIIQKSKELANKVSKYSNLRILQDTIDEMVDSKDIIEITGSAGTLILADSTYIHRGKKIEDGIRYAYTTYFY